MNVLHTNATIENDCWMLLSAEASAAAAPDTFLIPSRSERESLKPGDAAKLLFDIEAREGGKVAIRAVSRMWVIVKSITTDGYLGVLDNDPGTAEDLNLFPGDLVTFGPEHICDIATPPRDYVVQKYGTAFLGH